MKNALAKICKKNQNTHFFFNNGFFFLKSCRLWRNVEKYGEAREATNDVTIWRKQVAYWISKYKQGYMHVREYPRVHTQLRNTAFPRQK